MNIPTRCSLIMFVFGLLLLAGCGSFAGPQPTITAVAEPVPTAAVVPSAVAIAPTISPAPTARPSATPAPTIMESPTPVAPLPSPAARNPQTRLGTFFFYWYDCPRHECDAAQLSAVPPGWQTPLPDDHDDRDGTGYSSLNGDWYKGELRAMQSVGIDTIFPVSWGDHPHYWFTNETLQLLVRANEAHPLSIGMFIDTTAQQAMYNSTQHLGYRYGPNAAQLPLSDPMSGYFFYDRHIKGFFDQIPRSMWATEQGRPIIVAYTSLCCRDFQRAGAMWGAVKQAFEQDFGVVPWLILEDTWFTPEAVDPPAGMRRLEDVADGRYAWGAALHGPQSRTLAGYNVSSVGPGFDNRKITNIDQPSYQPRDVDLQGQLGDGAAFFRASLDSVPASTNLLLIETWNEWPESTGIARARYPALDGRVPPDDLYLQTLRRWRFGPWP